MVNVISIADYLNKVINGVIKKDELPETHIKMTITIRGSDFNNRNTFDENKRPSKQAMVNAINDLYEIDLRGVEELELDVIYHFEVSDATRTKAAALLRFLLRQENFEQIYCSRITTKQNGYYGCDGIRLFFIKVDEKHN